MRILLVLFTVGLFSVQANTSNWVWMSNSTDVAQMYIDVDSIRPYKEGDAKNSKDNYKSAFIEFVFAGPVVNDITRMIFLYVVNCDQNKLIVLDGISFDSKNNQVVGQSGDILSDSDMITVFPKTPVANIHSLICSK